MAEQRPLDVRLRRKGAYRGKPRRVLCDPKDMKEMRKQLLSIMKDQERAKEVEIEDYSLDVHEADNPRRLVEMKFTRESK